MLLVEEKKKGGSKKHHLSVLTHLSYLIGGRCRFLFLHIERVPYPVSLLPEQDRLGLLPHNLSRRDGFSNNSERDGQGHESHSPQLKPSHHLEEEIGEERRGGDRRGESEENGRGRNKGKEE